ncbi:MAG: hypothetical protein PHS35_01665 [Dehalococcoidales bacterium]|mgnify:CR=1 FL=1|nr:hypothetical protein [Dehalococcoidales bacterium]
MKKSVLITIIAVSLVIIACVISACAQEKETVTVTNLKTTTVSQGTTVFKTTTVASTERVTVTVSVEPPMTGTPPGTPHSLEVNYGNCFNCHLIPTGHSGRAMIQDLCWECHAELPVEQWANVT